MILYDTIHPGERQKPSSRIFQTENFVSYGNLEDKKGRKKEKEKEKNQYTVIIRRNKREVKTINN